MKAFISKDQEGQPSWVPFLFGSFVLSLSKLCFAAHQKNKIKNKNKKLWKIKTNDIWIGEYDKK